MRCFCELIAANRIEQGESYVGGGVALNLLTGGRRVSRDIDLFHDTEAALDATWAADRALAGRSLEQQHASHLAEVAGLQAVEIHPARHPDAALVHAAPHHPMRTRRPRLGH